jgi:hypothetical protein
MSTPNLLHRRGRVCKKYRQGPAFSVQPRISALRMQLAPFAQRLRSSLFAEWTRSSPWPLERQCRILGLSKICIGWLVLRHRVAKVWMSSDGALRSPIPRPVSATYACLLLHQSQLIFYSPDFTRTSTRVTIWYCQALWMRLPKNIWKLQANLGLYQNEQADVFNAGKGSSRTRYTQTMVV